MKTAFVFLLPALAFVLICATTLNNNFDSSNSKRTLFNRIDTPDQDRFVKVPLVQGEFTEPTELTVLPNLDILVAQRRGEIMLYKNQAKKLTAAGRLDG